jgi:Flp pilus assembly protein TadB
MSGERSAAERSGVLIGGGGLFMAICCIAAPAILGVAIGTTVGYGLDIGAVVLIVLGVAIVVHRRRAAQGKRC